MGFSADAPATRVAAVAVVQSDEARHHACLCDLACAQRQEANRSSSGRTGRTTRSTTASTAEGTELAGALRLLAHSGSQHTTGQTPRVTSLAALPSGSAGTAPPEISSSTTSRITPRCISGNRQAGQAGPWGTWPGGSASRHHDHQDHPYNCGSGAVFPYDRATCSAGPAFTVVRPASRQPARLCTGMTSGVPGSIPTLCRTGISTGP